MAKKGKKRLHFLLVLLMIFFFWFYCCAGWEKVFIKPAHGSSASGVVALRIGLKENKMYAMSSVELVRKKGIIKLFNSLRISKYRKEEDIKDIIDRMCAEKVIVEQWLPKGTV
jgi:hypothetical protein